MSLADTVRKLGTPRVLVVGDLVLDHYVFGTVDRISPEAPIGVFKVAREETRLGCAASAARNLAVLGAEVRLLGFLGSDEHGDELLRLAGAAGIEGSGIVRVSDRPTTRKTRLIASRGTGGQQVLRVDREEVRPYPEPARDALSAAVAGAVADSDFVVVSDYAKGTLDPDLLLAIFAGARESRIRVAVDPKPPGLDRYRGASVVTPNRPEAESYVGFRIEGPETAAKAAAKLLEDLELEAAVISLDKDGIYLSVRDGPEGLFPITPREVYDVTGAGDMVIATLAMVLAGGGDYPAAAKIANVAAGIEVSRLGVVPVSRVEILEALHEQDREAAGKVQSEEKLLEILAARRQRGERLVFTNGCYDVLHAGHVKLLRAARAEGDVLIVGLNSDASVRRLKGEGRPVTPQEERIETLSALACVDHVAVFEEDTPAEIIGRILPDVLVKGEDWRDKGVVGREIVEARGGKVVLVPLTPGLSSTEIIRKIREDGGER